MYKKLLAIQQEIGAIKKDATNPFFKSKYFDINSLLEQVKPVLNKHRVVLLQGLTHIDGKLALETTLLDSELGEIRFPLENNVQKVLDTSNIKYVCPLPETVDAQKAGSAITYFRRYALQSLLALEAEDDDANFASSKSDTREKVPYTKVADVKTYQAKNKADMDSGVEAF
jgi:hypothetical protein